MEKILNYLSLLNHRNTPRDTVLGNPAQRLMSRRTKTLLPATEELLEPRVVNAERVQEERKVTTIDPKIYQS